ncbi:MAG: GNAT family N-acetyltransferase [Burkholderiaceae bacterium]
MQAHKPSACRITLGTWDEQKKHAQPIRLEIFVVEQRVPLELEWDEFDASSVHALAFDSEGKPVGTGRLLPDGHIGRMAVLQSHRRTGIGSAILHALMQHARTRGDAAVVLNAQLQARKFYEQHGFAPEGDEFLDAGIPHIRMRHAFV